MTAPVTPKDVLKALDRFERANDIAIRSMRRSGGTLSHQQEVERSRRWEATAEEQLAIVRRFVEQQVASASD